AADPHTLLTFDKQLLLGDQQKGPKRIGAPGSFGGMVRQSLLPASPENKESLHRTAWDCQLKTVSCFLLVFRWGFAGLSLVRTGA
ncbi:hypothetical protein ACC755_37690, partial [Rhizobium ruizarguesonis]